MSAEKILEKIDAIEASNVAKIDEVKTILQKHGVTYSDEDIKSAIHLIQKMIDIQLRIDRQRENKIKAPWKKS